MNTLADSQTRNQQFLLYIGSILRDRVFMALVLMLALLAAFDFPQLAPSLVFTLDALWEMLPFFALAIGIAAYAKASSADSLIARAFSGNPVRATLLAALVGAISPFCSCGVIPLIAAMLGAGVVPSFPCCTKWRISSSI